MKLIKLALAALALTALAGCSNFVADFGVPTVNISPGSSSLLYARDNNGNQTLTGLQVTAVVQSLPGSPSGTVAGLNLLGGGTLPGSAIASCAPTSKPDDCPKITLQVTYGLPIPSQGSVVVTGYQAVPLNAQPTRTVNITPITLY
ncbi:MAG: hypothetical protein SFU83_19595 [Meiothermus sp.]|nr:hypothetical protein [Meiothermus sp.]